MKGGRLRPAGLLLSLGGVVVGLHIAGHGPLAAPPAGWQDAVAWYEHVGAPVAALALVRMAALAVAVWLLVATLVQMTVGVVLAPRAWGSLVRRLAGTTVAAGLTLSPLPTAAATPADDGPGIATVRVTGDPVAPVPEPPGPPAPVEWPATVLVEPGDSFWSLAEAAVGDSAEVAAYWRRLVAANRGALVEPGNPDLIHPGQRFVLPGD